jgi:hypothetical protein
MAVAARFPRVAGLVAPRIAIGPSAHPERNPVAATEGVPVTRTDIELTLIAAPRLRTNHKMISIHKGNPNIHYLQKAVICLATHVLQVNMWRQFDFASRQNPPIARFRPRSGRFPAGIAKNCR